MLVFSQSLDELVEVTGVGLLVSGYFWRYALEALWIMFASCCLKGTGLVCSGVNSNAQYHHFWGVLWMGSRGQEVFEIFHLDLSLWCVIYGPVAVVGVLRGLLIHLRFG
jgi:hypothetical protein